MFVHLSLSKFKYMSCIYVGIHIYHISLNLGMFYLDFSKTINSDPSNILPECQVLEVLEDFCSIYFVLKC